MRTSTLIRLAVAASLAGFAGAAFAATADDYKAAAAKAEAAIKDAHAEGGGFMVLSHDDSPWHGEHLFAVAKPVEGAEMVYLSGDFLTRVFEGPYSSAGKWYEDMKRYVEQRGRALETVFFYYPTCPKCASRARALFNSIAASGSVMTSFCASCIKSLMR